LSRPAPSIWAALALLVWSLVAIADGTDAAPPPSILVVLVLAIALAAARNRRMRTTGRLLLGLLAVVYVTAALLASLTVLTAVGIALSAATGLVAIAELVSARL
jgi:hypothetical protein